MSEFRPKTRSHLPKILLVAGVGLTASACGSEIAGGDQASTPPPSYVVGGSVPALMRQMFADHEVKKCTGHSGLLVDGNVRTGPDATPGTADRNIVAGYKDNRGNYILSDPERIRVFNQVNGDYSSHDWYIFEAPNGQELFVNHNALVRDDFICEQDATVQSHLGTISVVSFSK